jgi:hypothetical protein
MRRQSWEEAEEAAPPPAWYHTSLLQTLKVLISKFLEKKLCLKCRTSSVPKQDWQQECWLQVEVDDPQSSLPKWKEGRILQLQGLTIDPSFATTPGCTSCLASSPRGCSIGNDATASDFSPALILPRASPRQML